MENDDTFAPRPGTKSTWTHVKVCDTKEWHTADSSGNETGDAAAADAAGAVNNPYGEESGSSTHGCLGGTDASNSSMNERNLFRMTDALADRTFSFAPAETPPVSPSPAGRGGGGVGESGRGFGRKVRSMSYSFGPQLSAGKGSGGGSFGSGGGGDGDAAAAVQMPLPGPKKAISQKQFSRPVSMSSSVFNESPIPDILRRRLAGQVRHGLSQAEFAVRRDGKLLLAMVGLPARGKTYIAQSIKRHMDWFGLRTEIFNAGNYRRKFPEGRNASADLFDPLNAEVRSMRNLFLRFDG
ncbi:unnamed protein product [Ectocarpus sp. 12 AP-2014]